jgi:hypothetical protein
MGFVTVAFGGLSHLERRILCRQLNAAEVSPSMIIISAGLPVCARCEMMTRANDGTRTRDLFLDREPSTPTAPHRLGEQNVSPG